MPHAQQPPGGGLAIDPLGDGMVHTVAFRVADQAALDYWEARLRTDAETPSERLGHSLRFRDPEGLQLELEVDSSGDTPLRSVASDKPARHALLGFAGVRVHASHPERSRSTLERVLGFIPPDFEPLHERIEAQLTPLPPLASRAAARGTT